MLINVAGLSDTGSTREHNEDALLIAAEAGLFAVADGMGGQAAGEIASRMALDVLQDHMKRGVPEGEPLLGARDPRYSDAANQLASGIRRANQVIYQAGKSNPGWRNMGTTIVAALVNDNRLAIAHVGDSRCYLIRGGTMIQMTDDHSLVAEQERKGLLTKEEAAASPLKNIITRALGEASEVEAELHELLVMDGDCLLLCSDGLTNMVADREILQTILAHPDPEQACRLLVDQANANGGRDNITLILLCLSADGFLAGMRKIFSRERA